MKNNLIVYKNEWIIKRIYAVSERIRNKVSDQTLFEERCIKRVGEYLNSDESNNKNKRYIERLINEVASAVVGRNRKEYAELFSELVSEEDNEDKEKEFEPEDVLADVESEVITKEMTALLAQDDQRKKVILGYWAIGNTNHALISRLLAQSLGGNEESHRRAINRFRKDCYEYYSSKIAAV